ncbi:hypothetical protein CEQ90_20140 [Lewinellaceae bacterium SD302]|nr:hypothetical protein CEQ90_20140 [Lewinellaceae bacterium SD302]
MKNCHLYLRSMLKLLLLLSMLLPIHIFSQPLLIGDKQYDFSGVDKIGDTIKLSEINNKVILLQFTATFCAPCYEVYPQLNDLEQQYGEKIEIILIHYDEEIGKWNSIMSRRQIPSNFKSIWYTIGVSKEKLFSIYGYEGFPYFVLIDENKYLVDKWFGNYPKKLNRKIRRIMKT